MNTSRTFSCDLCPRRCRLSRGQIGFCRARVMEEGKTGPLSYGKVLALALDPIEKKPLAFFHPGSLILSVGTFGCNMACPFCQNASLARAGPGDLPTRDMGPQDLVQEALSLQDRGNIGLAFTYNEPSINFEYVEDSFKLAREKNLETVLVTNGQINPPYLGTLLPLTTAWNIDLKTFSRENYKKLGGDLETTLHTIERAAKTAHLEVTTLVVPGISHDLEDFKREVDFLAGINPALPLHLSRYFPSYRYHAPATDISLLEEMKALAEEKLDHVLLGNVW